MRSPAQRPIDPHEGTPAPPRLAERLLGWALPGGLVGRSIRGDLRQEFEERHAGASPQAMTFWYWRQASRLAAHYAWDRVHQLLERRSFRAKLPPRESKGRAPRMETLLQDIRFGIRRLTSNRGLTAVAVVTLALGIGANAAMFSIVNTVLLRPLEYPEPDRLVALKGFDLAEGETGGNTTPGNFRAWVERSTSFDAMATLGGDLAALTGHGDARRLTGLRSAGSLHEVLGVAPLFGRTLTLADDEAGRDVVVLSYHLWQSLYRDNRDILGDAVVLDNVPHTIIGVMPAGFDFRYYGDHGIDFWAPSGWSDEYRQNQNNYAHEVVARLTPGVSIERAQQEMEAIAAAMRAEFPVANLNHGVRVVRNAGLAADARPAVYFPVELASEWTNLTFALRTSGDPGSVMRAARARVRATDPVALILNEITAEQMLARQTAPTRAILQLIGAFAGLGLAMAAIGVFGVLSYSVSRRTREIGIRTALGANSLSLTSMIVGQAMSKVLAGTAIGVIAALGAGRFLAGMLYEVPLADPLTIGGVTLILCVAALLASYLPARRATKIDPTIALRSD